MTSRRILLSFFILLLVPRFGTVAQPDEGAIQFKPDSLVELARLDPTLTLDIRYATTNNFMKRKMYSQARAFLQKSAADALVRAHRKLGKRGYGLRVFDAYRPWAVTKKFWDQTPRAKRVYVANPAKGSKHNRGCAVDLTLYDLKTGRAVKMPSDYDDFTERASSGYPGGTEQQRATRDLLRAVMEAEGFKVNPDEWWHFDYKDWRDYRILNIPFEQLPE